MQLNLYDNVFNISATFLFLSVQLNMLEEGLINHPAVGFGESGRKANELRVLLAKIEESEVCIFLFVSLF